MSVFAFLSAKDQTKVDAKLAELSQRTSDTWTCEITHRPQSAGGKCLLELTVNGHILAPVSLDDDADKPGDRICTELDKFYEEQVESRAW